jgi:DNA-binding CsgD family transcriptional regulator
VLTQKAQKIVPAPSLQFPDGTVIALTHDVGTVGRRSDNTYVISDPRVSRVHAEIRREAGVVIITDLGSSAGTRRNGEKIDGPRMLDTGDTVSFGPIDATFIDPTQVRADADDTMVFDMPQIVHGPKLSARQQQVLELMADGLTNAEIGRRLDVTERTVKAYAQELYDKLGVRNRAGAVAEAARLGLLT